MKRQRRTHFFKSDNENASFTLSNDQLVERNRIIHLLLNRVRQGFTVESFSESTSTEYADRSFGTELRVQLESFRSDKITPFSEIKNYLEVVLAENINHPNFNIYNYGINSVLNEIEIQFGQSVTNTI